MVTSASLLSLNVSSNPSLTHLGLKCAALESVAGSQCHRLEQLQEDFSCPSLRTINLAGCKALQGKASHDTTGQLLADMPHTGNL